MDTDRNMQDSPLSKDGGNPLCVPLLLKLSPNIIGCYQWRTQEFCSGVGGGVSTNSVEDRGQRERGSGGGSPLVRDSVGSCNLVQEISFHIVKFS